MKLFDKYDAVRFPEENEIFVTHEGYLYFIYDSKFESWRKHGNAGNDYISVSNYPDVGREELIRAMGGNFPSKATDFLRLCNPCQLNIVNLLSLLEEDYPQYLADHAIHYAVQEFLSESVICYKSYLALKKLLDGAFAQNKLQESVVSQIKDLSFSIIGRDIFKAEIGIVDGHDCSSYFWIMPVRVIDYSNTDEIDNVAEMRHAEISIEEDDVAQYLTPFLYKYFDENLKANKVRVDSYGTDDDSVEQIEYKKGFERYLTHNFYTFEAVSMIIKDIRDTIEALSAGRENEFTAKLREKRGTATHQLVYAKGLSDAQIKEYNANRPKEDDTTKELIIEFYQRFIYRMEYMLKVGGENGYDLVSFMGP